MRGETALDTHFPLIKRGHENVLDFACRQTPSLPGLIGKAPFPSHADQVAADRKTPFGIILKQHPNEERAFGIVDENALVVCVSYVLVAQRRFPAPLAVTPLVFEAPLHVLG